MSHPAENDAPTDEEVEAAARGIHARQEYSTCWDDDQAGAESRKGTPTRPLGDHGREFYRGLARAALVAVRDAGYRVIPPAVGDNTTPIHPD